MKKLTTLFLLLFASINTFGQNAYYDALKLKTLVNSYNKFDANDSEKLKIAGSIMYKYLKNPDKSIDSLNFDIVAGQLIGNPFLKPFLPNGGAASSSFSSALTGSTSFFNNIGSTPVTNFADGLAKFLINRSKQELLVSFFEKLPDFENKYPEFKILFPNTSVLINNFESWEYANIIHMLREAFDKDLKQLLTNFPKISSINTNSPSECGCTQEACNRIKKYQDLLKTNEGIAISGAMLIESQFLSGNKLPDIIDNVASENNLAKINLADKNEEKNIKNTLVFLTIISDALRSEDVTKSYISSTDISTLLNDGIARNIFFGLLYQQIENKGITLNGVAVSDFLTPQNINGISTYIRKFTNQSNEVSESIKKIKTDKTISGIDLNNDWADIFQAINNFIPTVANIEIIDPRIKIPILIQQIVEKSQFATSVAHDIAIKNYSAAIVGILTELPDNNNKNEEFNEFKTFFVKYGSFAANVLQAQSSDEVEDAIESVALPVGSASIKKKTSWSIALNAYLGGFYGNEYLANQPTKRWAPISGVYAPVGITFSRGLNNWGSISALINIIDIGAITSFRLQDPTTENLPVINFQNILAPGFGLIYGLPWLPLSVGYTYQLGPALRDLTHEGTTTPPVVIVSPQMNRRWQFFVGVDIPIFNFYTAKSKKI